MRKSPFEKPPFIPWVDEPLVIQLPGERVRGLVRGVPDDNTAIVELVVPTLNNRTHRYKKGDYVPCRRTQTGLEEIWMAIDERQLEMAAAMKRLDDQRAHEAKVAAETKKQRERDEESRKRKEVRGRERKDIAEPSKRKRAEKKIVEKSARV